MCNVYAGNSSCTLIDTRFAKQLGLVNFDGRPTQAHSGTTRVCGVVHGAWIDVPVINIQYEIKGVESDPVWQWWLFVSDHQLTPHDCIRCKVA